MARARCHNPKAQSYHRYGARGITMCDRWRSSFADFLEDMGRKPSPRHELDRKNNDQGYSPDNCRWVLRWQNDRNRRNNQWVTFKGERRLLIELCEQFSIWPDTVTYRMRKLGWDVERAVETPVRPKQCKRGAVITRRISSENSLLVETNEQASTDSASGTPRSP
jgi:hypothetical protein